jgi:SAM-dependent methyltransferase
VSALGTRPPSPSEEKINRYDSGPYHWFLPYFYARRHERPLQLLAGRLKPADRVLDLGCGDGRHAALLARHVRAVVGLDHQMLPLQFARLLIQEGNVALARGDGTHLPLASQAFDGITCFDVIEHLPEGRVPGLLAEAYRVLKPGGWFVVTTPNRASLHSRLWGHRMNQKHYYEYTLPELAALFSKAGFCVEQTTGIYLPPPVLRPYLEHYANVFPLKHAFRLLIYAGAWAPGWSETLFLTARVASPQEGVRSP